MTLDTKFRRRMARTTASSDEVTADGSFDETRSVPCVSRGEHSGEHSSVSKFTEAMNNPDWRRRRDGCSACDSTATEDSNISQNTFRSHDSSRTSGGRNLPDSMETNPAGYVRNSIDDVHHQQSSLGSSEVDARDTDADSFNKTYAAPDQSNIRTTESKSTEQAISGLCSLLMQINITDDQCRDRPVDMLSLIPHFPNDDTPEAHGGSTDRGKPIVRIHRVRGIPRQRCSEQSQRSDQETEHLSGVTNKKSCQLPVDFPDTQNQEGNVPMKSSQDETLKKAREAVFNDPAVADIGIRDIQIQSRTNDKSVVQPEQLEKHEELRRRNEAYAKILQKLDQIKKGPVKQKKQMDRPKTNEELQYERDAYAKILQKLDRFKKKAAVQVDQPRTTKELEHQGKACRNTSQRLDRQVDQSRTNEELLQQRDAAFKDLVQKIQQKSGSQTETKKETSPGSSSIHHACRLESESNQKSPSMAQQRTSDSYDSGIGMTCSVKTRSKEVSQDSGTSVDINTFTQGLNPRAREFLSFRKGFSTTLGSQDIANLSDEDLLETMHSSKRVETDNNTAHEPGRRGLADLSYAIPIKRPGTDGKSDESIEGPCASAIPLSKQIPEAFNYTTDILPTSKFTFTAGPYNPSVQSMPLPGALTGLGLGAAMGNLMTPPAFGNQPNMTAVNALSQLYGVTPGPIFGGAARIPVHYNPMMAGAYSTRPPHVSKPAGNDPSQQQQYEAYIEWRKANEPGYALACKARQQRRAQRGSISTN
ncbi:hypothetical protein FGRMN_7968 [Fusarium graminum]|nr:hypothetical protein FGRMN_7968 [Fusarium graminum]